MIGYLIAKVVAKILTKTLQKVGFDRVVERGGVKKALAVDYVVRFIHASNKGRFVWRNMLDLLSIALPVLRRLRLLRLVALVRILNRKATTSLHGRVAIYVVSSAALIIFVASLAGLDAERGKPHANINTFGDAL